MNNQSEHTFHIPVMGLGYTIDTPVKVARYGINSVVSIIEDDLLEQMRHYYADQMGEEFEPIDKNHIDHRALRITAYLNLLDRNVKAQVAQMTNLPFEKGNDLCQYFELLPESAPSKKTYLEMMDMPEGAAREYLEETLRKQVIPGSIDVNIMTKVDRVIFSKDGEALPAEYSDAMAALRGYANTTLNSSLILSAGLNPRLYSYIESFPDFFPDVHGEIKKKIVLKVSDFRSATIQGKFLAKKGVWISEFRIESGLNCGGHAFATDGLLMGPILQEFKEKRYALCAELYTMCNNALLAKGRFTLPENVAMGVSVQGGIGTAKEDRFLREYYAADHTGWGSPFLMVPEATNVDEHTLELLTKAKKEDYFLSYASPLGVPFNNFRKSTSEDQRKMRVEKGRPGSPCYKEYLSTNTEFTPQPICTGSRQYQQLKIKQLQASGLPAETLHDEIKQVVAKDCLCEGLGSSVLIKDAIIHPKKLTAVTICPGPNLAYFSKVASLSDMIGHIYGRINLLNDQPRSNMFINELALYVDYYKNQVAKAKVGLQEKKAKQLQEFKANLDKGIAYYNEIIDKLSLETEHYKEVMRNELKTFEMVLDEIVLDLAGTPLPVPLPIPATNN